MKNSKLENWLNELNWMSGINEKSLKKVKHPYDKLNTEIEKLISVSLKEQMMVWEAERDKKSGKAT